MPIFIAAEVIAQFYNLTFISGNRATLYRVIAFNASNFDPLLCLRHSPKRDSHRGVRISALRLQVLRAVHIARISFTFACPWRYLGTPESP